MNVFSVSNSPYASQTEDFQKPCFFREFLKRSLSVKKIKQRCVHDALAVAGSLRGMFTLWDISPKTCYLVIPDLLFAAVSPLCTSLRQTRMCCLWEDRTSPNLKASPWFTLLLYQTGSAGKKTSLCLKNKTTPKKPPQTTKTNKTHKKTQTKKPRSQHKPPVSSLFNRLWKPLSWKHGSKEQTKLNSRLCLTLCLPACFAILGLVLWHTWAAQHCAVCVSEETRVIFTVLSAPGRLLSAQMEY